MVRISDARMSGTAYGTVVLHTAPEAAAGGTLAFVQNGDMIELNVPERRLQLNVPDEELTRRRTAWTPSEPVTDRGYCRLYVDHVLQADQGVDFDFLVGKSGAAVARPNISLGTGPAQCQNGQNMSKRSPEKRRTLSKTVKNRQRTFLKFPEASRRNPDFHGQDLDLLTVRPNPPKV